jgi:hypothetical protein
MREADVIAWRERDFGKLRVALTMDLGRSREVFIDMYVHLRSYIIDGAESAQIPR